MVYHFKKGKIDKPLHYIMLLSKRKSCTLNLNLFLKEMKKYCEGKAPDELSKHWVRTDRLGTWPGG